jgi:hypothetical protein
MQAACAAGALRPASRTHPPRAAEQKLDRIRPDSDEELPATNCGRAWSRKARRLRGQRRTGGRSGQSPNNSILAPQILADSIRIQDDGTKCKLSVSFFRPPLKKVLPSGTS